MLFLLRIPYSKINFWPCFAYCCCSRLKFVVCVCMQFFVKLQYHKQRQSAHGESRQHSADSDSDVLMHDDATHIDSSNVDVFSKSEACLGLQLAHDSLSNCWWSQDATLFHQESGGRRWMRKEQGQVTVETSEVCSIQWVNTDGSVTGRTFGTQRIRASYPQRFFSGMCKGRKTKGVQLTQVHLEKWPVNASKKCHYRAMWR